MEVHNKGETIVNKTKKNKEEYVDTHVVKLQSHWPKSIPKSHIPGYFEQNHWYHQWYIHKERNRFIWNGCILWKLDSLSERRKKKL